MVKNIHLRRKSMITHPSKKFKGLLMEIATGGRTALAMTRLVGGDCHAPAVLAMTG
jgi:hypothetical protein